SEDHVRSSAEAKRKLMATRYTEGEPSVPIREIA
ncbi:hypothetical protein Q604_UNBC07487G0001, partial [human gut metagenome]